MSLKEAKTNSKMAGPFGQYAWSVYDLNGASIDNGNELRLTCGRTSNLVNYLASSAELEQEACIILAIYTSPALFIAPMILNSHIKPKQDITNWFLNYGQEKSREKIGCWPLTDFSYCKILNNISPKALFVYGYIAPLSRKKNYTIENTPKSIKQYIADEELRESYNELSCLGLLNNTPGETWIHSFTFEAIETRKTMTEAVNIGHFIYAQELMTKSMMRDIEACRLNGWRLVSSVQPNRKEYCPCPICVNLPEHKTYIPLNDSILYPFHYNCGPWRPNIEMP